MAEHSVDVAVIGAGTAGLTARRAAEKAGASTLLIEDGPFGTTCARVGCMPSKLLIAAAEAAHHTRHAGVFGLRTTLEVDGPAVLRRVQAERDRFVGFVVRATERLADRGQVLRGRARFTGPGTLSVGDEIVRARSVVVATGSRPVIPEAWRPALPHVLTTDTLFELTDLPESVLVVGLGAIGLELGQALHRLGTRVTLLGRSGSLGGLQDPEVRRVAVEVLSRELDLHPVAEVEELVVDDSGVRVAFRAGGELHRGTWSKVLLAAGRHPNLAGLDLELAGVQLDERGAPRVDPHTQQVADGPVFLAGDVTGDRALLHEAADEGHVAGANAARFPDVRWHSRREPLSIVFTAPQLAVVGRPWTDLAHCDCATGAIDYGDQGRARVMNEHAGLVRVYGDRDTGRLVGAELCAPRAEHMAHALAWVIQQGVGVSEALRLPFYHPVLEEGLRTALRKLEAALRISGTPDQPCEDVGPGA